MKRTCQRILAVMLFALVLSSCMTHPTIRDGTPITLPAQAHPRLYLTGEKLAGLRDSVNNTHAHIWKQIERWTRARLNKSPPCRLEGDFRRTGELIPYAALCYRITDDPEYLQLAVRFMKAIAARDNWGNNTDIEAAHLLYGLAVGYDWLHDKLETGDRALIRVKLIEQAARMRPRCGQRHPPLNNHRIVNLCSLGTAALALRGETPDADEWLAHVDATLKSTMDHFNPAGYSCEGLSYWSYTTEYLLKYLTALPGKRHALLDHPWLKAAAISPIHHRLPRGSWTRTNLFLNIADSPRFCWYGPHYQLFCLASLYHDPHAQWVGDQLVRCDFSMKHADWLGLIWYDPAIPCETPPTPVTHHYEQCDLVIMRDDSPNQAVCSFKCGPAGGGHSHPDANSFTLFAAGAWLAVDAGATLVKRTAYHNTVIVNSAGQKGEGSRWLRLRKREKRDEPALVLAQHGGDTDYFVGDASRIYRRKAALTRFWRHFRYQRPDRITIVDELVARRKSQFDWLLHTPGEIDIIDGNHVVISNGNARLNIEIVQPEHPAIRTETVEIEAEYPWLDWTRLNRLVISPSHRTRTATIAVSMEIESVP